MMKNKICRITFVEKVNTKSIKATIYKKLFRKHASDHKIVIDNGQSVFVEVPFALTIEQTNV